MISIGTDIVKVSELKSYLIIKDSLIRFLQKKRLIIVSHVLIRSFHLVVNLSKEAVKKALFSSGEIEYIPTFKSIRILNKKDFSPFVEIDSYKNIDFSISVSHEKNYAIAFVHADIKLK